MGRGGEGNKAECLKTDTSGVYWFKTIFTRWLMKSALTDIFDSRTFYVAIVDAVVSTLAVMLALFFNPAIVDKILTVVLIWQPVVIAWIFKMTVQNVAGIQASAKIAEAELYNTENTVQPKP